MTAELNENGARRAPLQEAKQMSKLGQVVESVERYNKFVLDQVKRARTDEKFGRDLLGRWNDTKAKIPVSRAPTGLELPRLALPEIDEPGEIARYLFGEGLPGEFPFLNGAYREMYLEPVREIETGSYGKKTSGDGAKEKASGNGAQPLEEPTRLFSGLMLAEDTNERFHYLTQHQRTHRLKTAFWSESCSKTARHDSGRHFQGSPGAKRNDFSDRSIATFSHRHGGIYDA